MRETLVSKSYRISKNSISTVSNFWTFENYQAIDIPNFQLLHKSFFDIIVYENEFWYYIIMQSSLIRKA